MILPQTAVLSDEHGTYTLIVGAIASTGASIQPWMRPSRQSVMTVVAVIFVPIVLIYQGWTYYTFRKRVTRQSVQS